EICKIKGNFFVRVGMMNPQWVKLILDDLIEVYKNEKIFKFLHLPLESGSDDILKLMNRGYKVEDFLEIVERFREEIPSLTLSTDIIVGFPSESNRDFEATVKIIKEVKPDVVNLSKFGPKPGTKAAKLKQLDPQIIKKRSRELHDLIKTVRLQCNRKWVGWGGEVLIDERGKDGFIARNFAYKPIVIPASKNLFGEFVKVKIVKAKSNYLVGRIGN
ncbi:TPA: radical SAM protein, partial [Candidatus Bathyarchaeota archaeon]|nr:radical SAM protein [Candidatus Bathyarchaeota archaeon]